MAQKLFRKIKNITEYNVDTHGLTPVALVEESPKFRTSPPSEAFTLGLTPEVLSRGFDREARKDRSCRIA